MISESIDQLEQEVAKFEEAIAMITDENFLDQAKKLDEKDQVQLEILLCFALNNSIWSYMMLRGIDMSHHPILKELARVREYANKVKAWRSEEKRPTYLNKEAAKRTVKHHIGKDGLIQSKKGSTKDE